MRQLLEFIRCSVDGCSAAMFHETVFQARPNVSHATSRSQEKQRHNLFLPTYSPDLDPIERIFAKLKALLGKPRAGTCDAVNDAIAAPLPCFSSDECPIISSTPDMRPHKLNLLWGR